MIKQRPSIGRILAMVVFTLSCFGLLLFLWLSFGGPIPLKPREYRVKVAFPEATNLALEADVRMAGVNIGKVKSKSLDKKDARTLVTLEINHHYAPIPRDTQAILRQKTLLGETYVELAPGHKPPGGSANGTRGGELASAQAERPSGDSGMLADGGRLSNAQVEQTTQIDEIFSTFDKPTRSAFRQWVDELTHVIKNGRSRDVSDAFGNLEPFAVDGATLLKVLDEQGLAVRRLVRNTGEVFGAINQREGALRGLIVNAHHTFQATQSEQNALAQTLDIFPTFLDESRATLARLERTAVNAHPLVNQLKGPAEDLGPTVRDLGDLSPDLTHLFRSLPPLVRASRRGLPDLSRVLDGAHPLVGGLHTFLPEFNPILSYFNFMQSTVAGFFTNASADLAGRWGTPNNGQEQIAAVDARGQSPCGTGCPEGKPPFYTRGNAYLAPNALQRAFSLGTIESADCSPAGGEKRNPEDATSATPDLKAPPCFLQPPSLYDHKRFVVPRRGRAPLVPAPKGRQGTLPANPNR
jgi:phospholipid/cholesterol/gamma-HCH transport system substrate-binding protein